MASLTRTVLGIAMLASLACHSPPETRGVNEALSIYRRSARGDEPLHFQGRASPVEERGARLESPDTPLTVDAAIAIAKRNSARLAELDARVAAADAAIDAAGQRNNPEIRATNVRLARAIDTGQDLSVTPRIRLSPERPGEIAARQAEARAASREARAQVRAEELAVEAEIRWFFDDILLVDAELAASERVAVTRRKLAAQTREQLATATTTAVDASLADLYAIEAEAHVAERRSRRTVLVAALLDRIGRAPGVKLQLAGDPASWPPPPLPSEQTLIEAALKESPRVAGSATRIDGASARLQLEQARRWPWLRFVDIGYEFGPTKTNVPLWTVGAGIELPIFHANGDAVRTAEATKTAAKRLLEAEVQTIVRDVRARLREANAAAALVTEFRNAALPALEQANIETARALEAGGINALRALNVEERRSHLEVELLKLVRQYRIAVDALRRAVGGPLPSASASYSR